MIITCQWFLQSLKGIFNGPRDAEIGGCVRENCANLCVTRNMPEMPEQIAQNLAHLELEARSPSIMSSIHSPPPSNMHNQQQYGPRHSSSNYGIASPAPEPALWAQRGASPRPNYVDEPSFSPFPVLKERKVNVPPTDEEKEDILEGAREAVLSSNDPEMQLAWAQDTLAFVEIAIQNERRLSKTRPPRPRTPRVEHQLRVDAVSIVDFLANQHHPKAEFLKGTWLEFGRFGHPIDKREAYRCYSRSAQAGYPRSEYRMGMQFESSNEWDKAIQHYNLGIQHGDAASNYVGPTTTLVRTRLLMRVAHGYDEAAGTMRAKTGLQPGHRYVEVLGGQRG